MRRIGLLLTLVALGMAQNQKTSSFDPRLTVNTLVREDAFAGMMANDMERFERGAKNIDLLLAERPEARADLLAWKGLVFMNRAVFAREKNQAAEYAADYREALATFAEAARLDPAGIGVNAIRGGTGAFLGDRLAPEHRAENWVASYEAYQVIWKAQSTNLERLPVHIKGELLAGLAETAQRTGRAEESRRYVDEILRVLPGTPYEARARKWKEHPELAARTSLACQTCHEPGRLAAQQAALAKGN
jgi:tetratricopeptide (TPR) repeat protein